MFETVDGKQLVTFILKKEDERDQYVLISSISHYDLEEGILDLLPNTDLYYKSYFIEKKSRTTYYYGVNLPQLTHFGRREYNI